MQNTNLSPVPSPGNPGFTFSQANSDRPAPQQTDSQVCEPPFVPAVGNHPFYYRGTTYYVPPPPIPVLCFPDVMPVPSFHGYFSNRYTHGPDSYQANGNGNHWGSGNGNGISFGQPPVPINAHYNYTVSSDHQNFPPPTPARHPNAPFLMEHRNLFRNVQHGWANKSNMSDAYPAAPPWSDWYHRSNSEWKNRGKKRQNRKKYSNPDQNEKEEQQDKSV